jgi:uncharacterized protein YigA (DUF484 family)
MSRSHTEAAESENAVDETAVAQFLRNNPEFFHDNGKLLSELKLPHKHGGTVSLVERQIAVLREQNQRYQSQLRELVQIARDNDRLNEHIQSLTLRFIETDDINEILVLLNLALCNDFSADAVTLFLMMDEGHLALRRETMEPLEVVYLGQGSEICGFENVISDGEPCCGQFDADQRDTLFGSHADSVGSAVLLPLYTSLASGRKPLGLLAIGSQQAERFHAAMGTVFLKYLAELLSRRLWPHAQA